MKGIEFRAGRIIFAVGMASLVFAGCSQYKIPDYSDVASCEGCHTNYDHLREVYTPDTAAPVGGCGGGAPHIEPYDRVYMGGDGYEDFKASSHDFACTSCHGGINGTHEKEVAHSSDDFVKFPSLNYKEKCQPCHEEQGSVFPSSLHNGTGQKRKVAMRYGLEGPHQFDELPHPLVEGYNENCATCHGTCGNCHVNRPPIAGGGLAEGHNFVKNPDMRDICVKCHTSRGGHAYLGIAPGTQKDVHLEKLNFECLDCHTGMELHGNGDTTVTHRYAYSELPACEDCHTGLETSNQYHSTHYSDFNCHVCHSQDYNNCGQCHVHGDGALVPSYMDFKIAKNPIPENKPGYELVLVRRTLAWQENWDKYGITYPEDSFDDFPTYNYTSPHNILKITSRTDVGDGSCASKCHIRTEGDTTYNANLYLFESDLLDWELNATSFMTVDNDLPAGWFN